MTCYLLQTDVPVEACARLGRKELGGITVTVISCSAILSIRLYALYERNIFVLAGLIALMIVELIIMAISKSIPGKSKVY